MKLRSMLLACSPLLLLPGSLAIAQTLDQRRAEIKERWLRAADGEDQTQAHDDDAACDNGSADGEDAADDDATADDDVTADAEDTTDHADAADHGDADDHGDEACGKALVHDDDAVVDQDSRAELREDLRRRLDDDD